MLVPTTEEGVGAEILAPLIHRLRGSPSLEGEGFGTVRRMQVHTFAYQIQIQLQPQLQPRHRPDQIQIQTQKQPHTQKHIHPHSQPESGTGLLKVLKTLRFVVFAV